MKAWPTTTRVRRKIYAQICERKGETRMANELILAVDDEAHILELLSFNLEASGYRVVTATTGEDALTVCQ